MKQLSIFIFLTISILCSAQTLLQPQRITGGQYDDQVLYFTNSSVTADNNKIVYIRSVNNSQNIYVADVKTGEETQITFFNDQAPRALDIHYWRQDDYPVIMFHSVTFNPQTGVVYFLRDRKLHRYRLNGNGRIIAQLPMGYVFGAANVSVDGKKFLVGATDSRAFDEGVNNIDATIQKRKLVSRLLVYDTDTGEKLLDEPVPGAFITHVQFNPLDDHIIMYNHEWTASDYGIRRLWIYDCRSNKHIRVRTEAEERSRNDIVTHEVWERETGDFIYHGKFSQGVNKGCNFIGRVHFPKFPKLEGYTITEIPFPVEYQRNGHFNIGNNGWLVTDAYYVAQGEGKQPVGKGRWIALMKPDWDNKTLHWQLVCEHGSNWDSQEAHPHPVFDPAGNAVFFTSNKEGKRAVYRVDVSRYTQSKYTFEMPEEAKPEIVGRLLSERFLHTGHYQTFTKIVYPEVCTWTGALRFAQAVQDTALLRKLQERYEPLFIDAKKELTPKNHVDNNMFGSLPFMLYEATKEKRYFDMALPYADTQWALPDKATDAQQELANKGFTWQTRMWIDDMYMITIVQSQAYKATGDSKYIDRTAKEMVLYLDSLQRPNGLFYHAPDVPFFWGRGNGWMAAGMAELLKLSPPQHTEYQRIMKGYLTMMNSLKQYQNAEGLWNQLIDAPEFWSETSGSAMFTYAIIVGVSMGWLDANEFAPIAKKAWLALVKHINSDGDVTEVCVGTNKKNDRQYYYDRPRVIGDYHGQAAVLWCAFALLDFSL